MVYEVPVRVLEEEYLGLEEFQSMEVSYCKTKYGEQRTLTISVKSDSQCGQVKPLSVLDQTPPQAWQNMRSPVSAMA